MRKLSPLLLFVLVLLAVWWLQPAKDDARKSVATPPVATVPAIPQAAGPAPQSLADFLPAEAHATLALIARGGPENHTTPRSGAPVAKLAGKDRQRLNSCTASNMATMFAGGTSGRML